MSLDRSDKAYDYSRDASMRFDYFMAGLTGAITAYAGQTVKPVRLGYNPETLGLVALLLLIISVVAGLKQIEVGVQFYKTMHRLLYHAEARGNIVVAAVEGGTVINKGTGDIYDTGQLALKAREHEVKRGALEGRMESLNRRAAWCYRIRNGSLLVGFLLLVASRVLPAYAQ